MSGYNTMQLSTKLQQETGAIVVTLFNDFPFQAQRHWQISKVISYRTKDATFGSHLDGALFEIFSNPNAHKDILHYIYISVLPHYFISLKQCNLIFLFGSSADMQICFCRSSKLVSQTINTVKVNGVGLVVLSLHLLLRKVTSLWTFCCHIWVLRLFAFPQEAICKIGFVQF